ncbi:putative phage tail component-like protein [Pullulanibacillus pueri]|uniref:Phage tail protein n=1 Tax=Pullulanibacillus pueri TaxID=1437324 RepID=A0A8J2ZX30_9BACL|nr:distal tail protein Dit [Pullulanibacillus pueri]MBM7681940.1 putative phage tail component-like protein [Pullulanibacillus pueri]GGH83528.1 hypothetical protein GCM10007096_24530 [Pullulanibacillus pueri]
MDIPTFNFNGVESYDDLSLIVNDIRFPFVGSITEKTQDVPGMIGNLFFGNKISSAPIEIDITIEAKSERDRFLKLKKAAGVLAQTSIEEGLMIFSHLNDFAFYGHFTSLPAPSRINQTDNLANATLLFTCSDPRVYGAEVTQTINSPDEDDGVNDIVANAGTTDTYPVFTATVLKPMTFLQIISPDAYNQVGQPVDVEGSTVQEYELLIDDDMSSLNGWGQSDYVTDGYARGTIETDGSRFYPTSFGDALAPERWQGPAIKKALSQEVQDFEMNAVVRAENVGYETGMLEVYLLDAQNNQVGRIHMADSWTAYAKNEGRVELGMGDAARFPYITNPPGNRTDWNNFYGMLKLQRRGSRWWFYFARIDGDRRTQISEKHYIPPNGLYMDKVAQVQIAFRKWPNTNHSRMGVYALKFWKLNDVGAQQVPYIADVGDVLTFDHKNASIAINGDQSFIQYKDFGASYFPIGPGQTQIAVNPPDVAKVDVNLRSAWL